MKQFGRQAGLRVLIVTALVVGLAPAAVAQVGWHVSSPRENQELLEGWQRRYQEIRDNLKTASPKSSKRARKRAAALFEDVLDRAVSGEVLCETAGRVLTLLAVADAREGDRHAALWHWQMAQNVSPDLKTLDFSEYPDVGPFLLAATIPESKSGGVRGTGDHNQRGPRDDESEPVEPPQLVKTVRPRYPAGLNFLRIGEATQVDAFIDTEGRVEQPVVRHSCGHLSLDLAAMEALRGWMYKPATRGGKPIQVFLTLTVDFQPRR